MTTGNERKRAKVPRKSAKGGKGQEIQPATRAALLDRSRGFCEAGFKGCAGRGDQAHHRKYRSRGGSNALVNLAWICSPCHDATHRHRPGTERMRTPGWAEEGQTE